MPALRVRLKWGEWEQAADAQSLRNGGVGAGQHSLKPLACVWEGTPDSELKPEMMAEESHRSPHVRQRQDGLGGKLPSQPRRDS